MAVDRALFIVCYLAEHELAEDRVLNDYVDCLERRWVASVILGRRWDTGHWAASRWVAVLRTSLIVYSDRVNVHLRVGSALLSMLVEQYKDAHNEQPHAN